MATVNYIREKKQTVSAMKGVMNYCSQEQKVRDLNTNHRLVSGINCNGEDAFRPLRKFCVSDIRQNQEYHTIHVHDWGLFPLATAFSGGWDGMRAGTA